MRPQALLDFLLQQLNVRQNVSYLQRGTGLCTCKNEGEDLSSDSHQWNNRGNKERINRIYYMFTCCITSPTVKFYWSKIQHQLTAYERPNKFLLAFENVLFSIFYFFSVNTDSLRNYLYICFLTITLHYCIINNYIQNLQLHFMLTLF